MTASIAIAINVYREPLIQVRECFSRIAAHLPKAKVGTFLNGVIRPEVDELAEHFRFSSFFGANFGTNATWNLWWLRMLRYFAQIDADICFKFDPDTMVDKAPRSIPSAGYFGRVCGSFVQGGITGMSQKAVRAILKGRLLERVHGEPRPWLEQVPEGEFMDDQLISQVFASLGILPVKWSECHSRWRRPVPNRPVRFAIVHPRYYSPKPS